MEKQTQKEEEKKTNTNELTLSELAPKTLHQLLQAQKLADAGLLEIDWNELEVLGANIHEKVDSCQYIHERYRSVITEMTEKVRLLTEVKRSLEGQFKRYKDYLCRSVEQSDLPKVPGDTFYLSTRKTKSLETTLEPDNELWLRFNDCIERSFKWKKLEIKKAMEKDPELQKYVVEKETKTPIFKSKREI